MEQTTIRIERITRERLAMFGNKGDTYDEIINRLLDMVNAPVPSGEFNRKEVERNENSSE